MAALGFRFTTVGETIEEVFRLTPGITGDNRERRLSIRDGLVRAYEQFHDEYDLGVVRERDITFTWTSGRSINLSTVTATDSDGVAMTGITGWRGRPARVKSEGEDYAWQLETSNMIDFARDQYDRGDDSAKYKYRDESRGFMYAVEGDKLITVEAITNETITFDHYREPTAITRQSPNSTAWEFPREFLDLLVYTVVYQEWVSALMQNPTRYKEQRRAMEAHVSNLAETIQRREKALQKSTEIPPDVLIQSEAGPYAHAFYAAEEQWNRTTDDISKYCNDHLWR